VPLDHPVNVDQGWGSQIIIIRVRRFKINSKIEYQGSQIEYRDSQIVLSVILNHKRSKKRREKCSDYEY
jgi:hypothetical protein